MNTKNKQRTATVTWITYNNFGTYLQAYALQRVVHSLGYEKNHIISDRRFVEALNKKPIWWRILAALYHFLNGRDMMRKERRKSDKEFEAFANRFLLIDKDWRDYSDLDRRYDMYICGSDQIWSPILHMNPYYFSSYFKKNMGINFKDYLGTVRLRHAMTLLVSTDRMTYDIAAACGFPDARAFSDLFQKTYGEKPSKYRKRLRENQP